jgi:hypothetical protein
VPSNGKHLIFLLTNYTPVMKKIIFFVTANLIAATAFTQFIYKIKADSVLITNDSCNAELNLENRTKDTIGFLYNRGKGRTEFRRGAIKINNSTYLIGADTIITGGGGAVEIALNGLTKVNDTIKLGGDLIENTNINLQQKRLRFYLSDPTSSSTSAGGVTITGARGVGSGNDPLYVQIFNRPAGSFSGTSVFAETFWQPTAPVPSGSYSNYISVHKSDNANIDMSGLSLYDYRTIFYVNNVNQNYGSRYHFYADGSTGNNPIMTNHMGLYVAPLKRPTIANAYAIYSAGVEDSIFNAGPVRWTKYKNNALGDSVLTTDINGNIKLKLASGGGSSNAWNLTGNAGTNPITNFLGTTDNISLRIRTNNIQRAIIDSNGRVGINTAAPVYQLDVNGDARISTLPIIANRDTVLTYNPSTKQVSATKLNVPQRTLMVANFANTTTSYLSVTGLSFTAEANKTYSFRFFIVYTSAATTTGSRWSVTATSLSFLNYRSMYSLTATSRTMNEGLSAINVPAAANATSATTTSNIAVIEGVIRLTATGSVSATVASEVAASAITALGGRCYVEYEVIAN